MYFVSPHVTSGYGQSEDGVVRANTVPQTQTTTSEVSEDRSIQVIGLALAFFSTLVLTTSLIAQRRQR